ncbi:extracellular catalytic domain type 1 short-chain-length polyhydroxyalkanoate depolymerase [Polyangium sorediatum]|uniref:Alpha/beta hydrolase-fold protein n=1 Tax=Polyangium sorediatum TaxID=889274 RepID=A0ABT6P8D3_9BACT|nr:PHB depolymerase family esterase [Polyangium sorediatum]MDI1436879.1 alpha/beta hydrolase-fold protein [Polyangium sorediatum]
MRAWISAWILLVASCGGGGESISLGGGGNGGTSPGAVSSGAVGGAGGSGGGGGSGGESASGSGGGSASGSGSGGGGGSGGGSASGSGGSGGSGGRSAVCVGKSVMPPGDKDITITTSGEERSFRVHVPPGYDAATPVAVVLAFHGYTESIDDFASRTHYAEAVDERGHIVVFPRGKAPFGVPAWNAGTCCGTSQVQNTPDVPFVRDMLDRIEQDYCVDPKRIHATGFSNGGMLSHRLACELADRIASIGAVSGTMAIPECAPPRPVPVLHIHGTSDLIVPYATPLAAQTVPSTIEGWTTRNGCNAETQTTYQQGKARCERQTGCDAGADVELCTIDGGSHEWPAGGSAMGMGDLAATDYILDFLEAHAMP